VPVTLARHRIVAKSQRGQLVGVIGADLAPADLPRLVAMLYSVLQTMDPGSDGWHRYVSLMLDAISAVQRRPLPPVATLRFEADPAAGRCRSVLQPTAPLPDRD
jgi:hypothetical protein